ncbi:uncharacterized protein LOC121503641 [Cheilinus undulatus]|uniref:uncharacterized protein LOC121503641 n=1 Tax=Cheilinus undulatus TaxID=241271 RepID=UPI001BD2DE43|nr:uncharacterized protein LOC121503641 [Cheilinus undulatus]
MSLEEKMLNARKKTQDALSWYVIETLLYIETVKQFCGNSSEWLGARRDEVSRMEEIKNSYSMIDPGIRDLFRKYNIIQAIWEYVWNKLTLLLCESAKTKRSKLERDLAVVLRDSLCGLEKLNVFLEAVENLAVTSLHVFQEGNQVLNLPDGIRLEHVQDFITAVQQICPQLLKFKRDASAFFLPKLDNVEELMHQLDRYIQTAENICGELEMSCSNLFQTIPKHTDVILDEDLTDDGVQRMLDHIDKLAAIRMDPDFRVVFLFKDGSCPRFIEEFTEQKEGMLQNLEDLEETADKLDHMNKRAKIICNILLGNSAPAIGNVLSIIGFSLIPDTTQVSLWFTFFGMMLSGSSSIIRFFIFIKTIITCKHQKEAEKVFKSLMTDVKSVQNILEEMPALNVETEGNDRVFCCCCWVKTDSLGYTMKSVVDAAFDIWLYKEKELIESTGKVITEQGTALHNMSMTAFKGPLSLSDFFQAFTVGSNLSFLIMDLIFIRKEWYSLSKGDKTELSESIRARAALWRSELDALEKIHDSATKGLRTLENDISFLNSQFYI